MSFRHSICGVATLAATTLCFQGAVLASAGYALSADEFAALIAADQTSYLHDCVVKYRETTRNISATVAEYVKTVRCDPKTLTPYPDRVVAETDHKRYQVRRIGESYWIHFEITKPRAHKTGQTPVSTVSYSAETGVEQQLDVLKKKKSAEVFPFGNIDSTRGHLSTGCPLFEFLGDNRNECDDIGSAFLGDWQKATITSIDRSSGIVKVKMPFSKFGRDGFRLFSFDLSKEGVLFSKQESWSKGLGQNTSTGEDDIVWSDFVKVSGAWVPTRLRIEAWRGSPRPRQITIHEATVSDIRVGALTPSDLALQFPPGTEVLNRLTDTHIKINESGTEVESKIKLGMPMVDRVMSNGLPLRIYCVWLTALLTIALSIGVAIKRFRGRVPMRA